jgi:hypothetical protein
LAAGAQPYLIELIRQRENCKNLPNHAMTQECQAHQRAEYKDWEKQMNERYAPMPSGLNGVTTKPPMNCFKRESTGEQVCAN